jgi:hypothetical protein
MRALLFSFTRLTNERRFDYQPSRSQPAEFNPLTNHRLLDYLLTRQPLPELSTLLLAWPEAFYSCTRSVLLQHADLFYSAIGYMHYFMIVGLIALRMAEDWMLDSTIIMLLQVY